MTQPAPKRGALTPQQTRRAAAGGAGALAIAAAVALLPVWEGKVNDPHWDRFGRVHDVCYGETRVAMRHYSDAECLVLLEAGAAQFQNAVLAINPRLATDPLQWAAHTSLAYNIGLARYRASSVARLYRQGHERAACEAIKAFRLAGGHVLPGLVARRGGDAVRLGEAELCLTAPPSPWSPPA